MLIGSSALYGALQRCPDDLARVHRLLAALAQRLKRF